MGPVSRVCIKHIMQYIFDATACIFDRARDIELAALKITISCPYRLSF